MAQLLRVDIEGAVQGVGFRPFVYRLARALSLTGWVVNGNAGVRIEAEGGARELNEFLERLAAERPPRAVVHSMRADWGAPRGYPRFEIRESDHEGVTSASLLPDAATCVCCLAEVLDPANRRHLYPFANCTQCGPRFTIVESLPYDRPGTTMRSFGMCDLCRSEYEDPEDRRFHAQPNACEACGPRLSLWGPDGRPHSRDREAVDAAAEALRSGRVVAVKGLGGFHLMVDAGDQAAVTRLRRCKPRREKPLALMVRDPEQAADLCEMDETACRLLDSPESPIVLMPRRAGAAVADAVAPGCPTLGLMLPATPLHHLLMRATGRPLVATSGNLSDEPICTDESEAVERLGGIADLFLVHDRPIARHVDDSVAWVAAGRPRLLRRARGYAPLPVMAPADLACILAVGPHLKNTVALSVGRRVFISQHIGDLETPAALQAFDRVIHDFLKMYEARPVAIAHDLHPDYLSTQWAVQEASGRAAETLPGGRARLIEVQHHHAHLASCLADNGVAGPALGVTWDGTGFGTDGTIWGGEFLVGDAARVTRVAHLRRFRLPGGDAAAREPRRAALGLLWEMHGAQALERSDLAPIGAFEPAELRLLGAALARGVNAPVATSMGRVFDAVASLIGLRQICSYEGQAAMELENLCDGSAGAYPLPVVRPPAAPSSKDRPGHPGRDLLVLDWAPLIEAVLEDVRRAAPPGTIASRFIAALAESVVQVAREAGEPRVALTGGCFQNRRLLERTAARLGAAGFEVLIHRQVPPNDGGISLGQVMVAAERIRRAGG